MVFEKVARTQNIPQNIPQLCQHSGYQTASPFLSQTHQQALSQRGFPHVPLANYQLPRYWVRAAAMEMKAGERGERHRPAGRRCPLREQRHTEKPHVFHPAG